MMIFMLKISSPCVTVAALTFPFVKVYVNVLCQDVEWSISDTQLMND